MPVFKLTIEYNGRPFHGWQRQPGQSTVQGTIEAALATITRQPTEINGASRTDAGVHALGQVATFETENDTLSENRLVRGISALCRPHIAVVKVEKVSPTFSARFDTTGKHYQYCVLNRSAPSPLFRHRSWHVPQQLDLDKMQEAAALIQGTHDFRAFRASDCERTSTVRELSQVWVQKDHRGLITIDVKGTGFLKYMVRIISGTLVDISRGAKKLEDIEQAYQTGIRQCAGQTAPPYGLTLMEVFY